MTIKTELLALQQAAPDGILKAETVVAWAQSHPASALYRNIEWDDANAAAEYRLWQVRRLIQVHVVDVGGAPVMVSLSIDRTNDGGGYRKVSDVLTSAELSAIMLKDALQALEHMQARFGHVKELVSVWNEVEKVKTRKRQPRKESAGQELRTA